MRARSVGETKASDNNIMQGSRGIEHPLARGLTCQAGYHGAAGRLGHGPASRTGQLRIRLLRTGLFNGRGTGNEIVRLIQMMVLK
jgi:hypothetical protein